MHIITHALQIPPAPALHHQRLVTPAEHVPDKLVPVIESQRVTAQQPAHPRHQIALGRLHDHMKVIGHHAVGKDFNGVEPSTQPQEIGKGLKILILVEDVSLPVATVEDVIDETISEGSRYSWHFLS